MTFQDGATWALSALIGVCIPFAGWAVRTHQTVTAHDRRIAEIDAWKNRRETTEERLAQSLTGVQVELARLAAIQTEMREAIRRLEETKR